MVDANKVVSWTEYSLIGNSPKYSISGIAVLVDVDEVEAKAKQKGYKN